MSQIPELHRFSSFQQPNASPGAENLQNGATWVARGMFRAPTRGFVAENLK
jgi:hypothetical protein